MQPVMERGVDRRVSTRTIAVAVGLVVCVGLAVLAWRLAHRSPSVVRLSTHTGFHDLAPLYTDSHGNVYVQTGLSSGLLVFSPDGRLLRRLGGVPGPSGDCGPWGVAVGPDRRIYVADCAIIWVYSTWDSQPRPWYAVVAGPGALSAAWNIVFDRHGIAYASDLDNNRIVKISRSGSFLGALAAGNVVGPWGLALERAGTLIVVEHRADSLAWVAPDGTILKRVDLYRYAAPLSPTDVAVGRSGVIYVNARDDDRILRFAATGKYEGTFVRPGKAPGRVSHPMGIATDPEGDLYVSDAGNNRIEKFSPSGVLEAIWKP